MIFSHLAILLSSLVPMSDRVFLHFRVKFIIEEIERDEAALREDLYSADRKFAEYYNVGEKNIHIVLCKPKI